MKEVRTWRFESGCDGKILAVRSWNFGIGTPSIFGAIEKCSSASIAVVSSSNTMFAEESSIHSTRAGGQEGKCTAEKVLISLVVRLSRPCM